MTYSMTDEQRQAILTRFYAEHPEMRTEASYRADLLAKYSALQATDADLPHRSENHDDHHHR